MNSMFINSMASSNTSWVWYVCGGILCLLVVLIVVGSVLQTSKDLKRVRSLPKTPQPLPTLESLGVHVMEGEELYEEYLTEAELEKELKNRSRCYFLGVRNLEDAMSAISQLSFCVPPIKVENEWIVQSIAPNRIWVSLIEDENSVVLTIKGAFTQAEVREIKNLSRYAHEPLEERLRMYVAIISNSEARNGVMGSIFSILRKNI